jgi:hypothetical protein
MLVTSYETLFSTVWFYTHDYIILIMALVMTLVIGIMMYEWFRTDL